jgi:hypothetical protein
MTSGISARPTWWADKKAEAIVVFYAIAFGVDAVG